MRPAITAPQSHDYAPEDSPPRPARLPRGALTGVIDRLEGLAPAPTRQLLRRARAGTRAAVLEAVPLPLFETWKLKSLDPFVVRATTLSQRVGGRHFLVLAARPMTDSGGGRRPAQLACELLERGHRVTYVYRFASHEYRRRRRALAHPNLTHAHFDEFSAVRFAAERFSRERVVALCELPLAEYRLCLRYLRQRGAQTLYDCYDDWEVELRGKWYARGVEERLLAEVDAVTAAAAWLRDALAARGGRDVALLPNAFNSRLFSREKPLERPPDLPRGEAVFTYVGSSSSDRFAWDWVLALARARPEAQVVLIGDHRGHGPGLAPNLHLLGLRPQSEIPAYLQHSDVCLLPRAAAPRSRTACPLKVYEYLALGKPVVAAEDPVLHGMPGVFLASGVREFVELVGRAEETPQDEAALGSFLAANAWRARIRQLERLLGA